MNRMKEELRTAYSIKEKFELLLGKLDKLKAGGSVNEAQYEKLRTEHTEILKETMSQLDSIKAKLQKELEGKSIELSWFKQELEVEQTRLKVGEIGAKTYRKRGEPFEKKVKQLEKEVAELTKLTKSSRSTDVGGTKNIRLPKIRRENLRKERINHPSTEISRPSSLSGKTKEIAKRPSFFATIGSVCFLGLVIWAAIALINKTDLTPPTVSNVSVSSITESSAVVSWMTDEPVNSQVSYRELDSDETQIAPEPERTFITKHSLTLSDLKPGTVYWLNIVSLDASGNRANYDAGSIKTLTLLPPALASSEVGNKVGNQAPDFTLATIYGDNVTLSDFTGKIVILNFWLYGCSLCDNEMPHIQSIYNKWSPDKLAILAINVLSKADNVKFYAEKKNLTFPILLDSDGAINETYKPSLNFPTTFFIDTKGIIREVIREKAFASPQEIETLLKSLQ